ncbi:PAAR domain-containing protein [Paraburkholderia sp. J67]|uniref:PAAR domain-containing protein n=1 Tax=Paraburkholderia sp. J67 TaxID=2805435 RepID=UPI002ABD89EF|nr:PAAR domain-containing protein [Paraburkholderia sp. J67]
MSDQQKRKGKMHAFATIGARTERGGCVTTGSPSAYCGLAIARVGDVVTYSDGSEAVIMDGAGFAMTVNNRPVALVGSSISNGDRIISTIWEAEGIFVADGETIEGLFDADYVPPPPRELRHRFAVKGATTLRGGVLKSITGNYRVGDRHTAARIGDFVEYADGSRARIITGIGLPGKPDYAFGAVGSLLDNGDTINDSPHRDLTTCTSLVPVDQHGNVLTRQ